MSELVFLTVEQVKTLHRLALEQHGGQDGVRDLGAFESAVAHPQNVWFLARVIYSTWRQPTPSIWPKRKPSWTATSAPALQRRSHSCGSTA